MKNRKYRKLTIRKLKRSHKAMRHIPEEILEEPFFRAAGYTAKPAYQRMSLRFLAGLEHDPEGPQADSFKRQLEWVGRMEQLAAKKPTDLKGYFSRLATEKKMKELREGRLFDAARNGDVAEIQGALSLGADIEAREGPDGNTALILASVGDHVEALGLLLKSGAAPNAANRSKATALIYSAFRGCEEAVKLLLEAGADPDLKDEKGYTALQYAEAHSKEGAAEILREHTGRKKQKKLDKWFLEAAEKPDVQAMAHNLQQGADIEARNAEGESALILATKKADADAVEFLISNGADVDVKANMDWTALMHAASAGSERIVKALLEAGADAWVRNAESGQNAIEIARFRNRDAVAGILERHMQKKAKEREEALDSRLLEAAMQAKADEMARLIGEGAHVDATDHTGRTPLMNSCLMGCFGGAMLLLDNGAEVNANDVSGGTALMDAAANGHIELVKLLVKRGADVLAQDDKGKNAWVWASRAGHWDIASFLDERMREAEAAKAPKEDSKQRKLNFRFLVAIKEGKIGKVKKLRNKGADVDAKDDGGTTGLMVAAGYGHPEIAEFLIDNGADVNARMYEDGRSALMIAAERGLVKIVRQLLQAGADVTAKNAQGEDALSLASYFRDKCAVQPNTYEEAVRLIEEQMPRQAAKDAGMAPLAAGEIEISADKHAVRRCAQQVAKAASEYRIHGGDPGNNEAIEADAIEGQELHRRQRTERMKAAIRLINAQMRLEKAQKMADGEMFRG